MVAGARMCGTFITKKVPIALMVGVVAFVISGGACLGVYGNTYCYQYSQYTYCNNYYRNNLLITGISCMVSAGVLLVVGLSMFYKISNAPQEQPYPAIGVVQGATLPYQQYGYPAQIYPSQQPPVGFTVQQDQLLQQQQQQQPPIGFTLQQQQQQQQQQPPPYEK